MRVRSMFQIKSAGVFFSVTGQIGIFKIHKEKTEATIESQSLLIESPSEPSF